MIGLLFIVSVTSVILFILVAISPLPALKEQEASLQQTLTRSKDDVVKFDLLKERMSTINTTLSQRQSLTAILLLLSLSVLMLIIIPIKPKKPINPAPTKPKSIINCK